MDRKRLLIIVSCVALLVLGLVAYYFINAANQPKAATESSSSIPENRSTNELTLAIAAQAAELAENGQPIFTIDSVKKPLASWYVVTMYLKDDPQKTNPAKILLQDHGSNGGLEVVLGPGTAFPSEETQAYDIPQPVAEELNK